MSESGDPTKASPAGLRERPSLIIARNSLLATADTIATFLIALAGSIAVARALGPVKLGYYSYAVFICNVANQLASLGVPMAARKFLAELVGRDELDLASAVWRLTSRFQLLAATCLVAAGLGVVAWRVPAQHRIFAWLVVLSLAPAMQMAMATSLNVAMEDFASNVKASLASAVIGFGGLVIALVMGWDLVGLAGALLTERTTDFILRYRYARRHAVQWAQAAPAQALRLEQIKRSLRRFCLQSTMLQALNLVIWDRSEMFFLKQFSEIRQLAFYSLAFNITQRLLMLPRAFMGAASATVMVRIGRDPNSAAHISITALRYIAVLALPMSLGIAALSDPLVRIMYGSRYLETIPVLAILGVFASAKALMLPAESLLIAANRQSALLKVLVAAASLNVALDFWLIPRGGAIGAAVANSAAQTAAAIAIWFAAMQGFRVAFPLGDLARLALAATLSGSAAWLAVRTLPPLQAVSVAVPVGVIVFGAGLRYSRVLRESDRQRLLQFEERLPVALRASYRRALGLVLAS